MKDVAGAAGCRRPRILERQSLAVIRIQHILLHVVRILPIVAAESQLRRQRCKQLGAVLVKCAIRDHFVRAAAAKRWVWVECRSCRRCDSCGGTRVDEVVVLLTVVVVVETLVVVLLSVVVVLETGVAAHASSTTLPLPVGHGAFPAGT